MSINEPQEMVNIAATQMADLVNALLNHEQRIQSLTNQIDVLNKKCSIREIKDVKSTQKKIKSNSGKS